jgi:hypothetical protein
VLLSCSPGPFFRKKRTLHKSSKISWKEKHGSPENQAGLKLRSFVPESEALTAGSRRHSICKKTLKLVKALSDCINLLV